MNAQASLFDAPLDAMPARALDPETSKAAARQLDVRARQQEVLIALRHRGVSSTAEEILGTLHAGGLRRREKGEVRSRLSELADARRFDPPLVRKVGVRQAATGRPNATWDLTAAGRQKCRELEQ